MRLFKRRKRKLINYVRTVTVEGDDVWIGYYDDGTLVEVKPDETGWPEITVQLPNREIVWSTTPGSDKIIRRYIDVYSKCYNVILHTFDTAECDQCNGETIMAKRWYIHRDGELDMSISQMFDNAPLNRKTNANPQSAHKFPHVKWIERTGPVTWPEL